MAPPALSIPSTVLDDGGSIVLYMTMMLTLLTYQPVGNLCRRSQHSRMFEHQERVAILLLVCVAFTVIAAHLVLISIGKHPFASEFSNSSPDGELVIAQGTIEQVTVIKNGGHILLRVDDVAVFIPAQVASGTSYAKGKNITLYGTVQTFRGEKEIMVSSAGDIGFLP